MMSLSWTSYLINELSKKSQNPKVQKVPKSKNPFVKIPVAERLFPIDVGPTLLGPLPSSVLFLYVWLIPV
jgi:hypothetical protein